MTIKTLARIVHWAKTPLRLPLDRGRDKRAPPLLRGGWEGFGFVINYVKHNKQPRDAYSWLILGYAQAFINTANLRAHEAKIKHACLAIQDFVQDDNKKIAHLLLCSTTNGTHKLGCVRY